ncbi:MAG: hypothetical protein WCK34_19080, partial [Bacteroidota bacterium]
MMMNIPVFCRRLPVFFALSLLMMVSFKGYSQRWVEEHAKAVITPYMIGQTAGNLASVALKGRKRLNPRRAEQPLQSGNFRCHEITLAEGDWLAVAHRPGGDNEVHHELS